MNDQATQFVLRCSCARRVDIGIAVDGFLMNRPVLLAFLIDHGPGADHVITTHLVPNNPSPTQRDEPTRPPHVTPTQVRQPGGGS